MALKTKQKKYRSMQRKGKEKEISYSEHRRVWIGKYSLEYSQMKLPQSTLTMRCGYCVDPNQYIYINYMQTFI